MARTILLGNELSNTNELCTLGHKFNVNRTKIHIPDEEWNSHRKALSDSMQIAGQKSLSRTFPVQEFSKLAELNKLLSHRQRFFILFPVKQEELY